MTGTSIHCCQLSLVVGDTWGNRSSARASVESAAAAGADIVVLPELCNSGYVFIDSAEARALAEPADGPTITAWVDWARTFDVIVIGGFCEVDSNDRLRNSAVLIDPHSGVRAIYRKTHLWERETELFTPGDERPPVIDTWVGRIGVIVCYDLEFPEWSRLPALAGAQLLCVPTNWPRLPRPANERPIEVVRAQAAASVNRMFVAVCDRAGDERKTAWVGGSAVIDADGWPLTPSIADRSGSVSATCDLNEARLKAVSDRNDVHDDRRPELYMGLWSK